MSVEIRQLSEGDLANWVDMRCQLWPAGSPGEHRRDIMEHFLVTQKARGFGAELDGVLVGFLEVSLRDWAEGCTGSPVPYIEGVWVSAASRAGGVARSLLQHVTTLVRLEGYRELASDAEFANELSHETHLRWGFEEVVRLVCYRKDLS